MNLIFTIPSPVIHFLCCLLVIEYSSSVPSEAAYRRLLRAVYRNASTIRSADNMQAEGSVRLTGGRSKSEGNVEIYHMGKWGSICDDEFDMSEGNVICRSLGFPMGAHSVTGNGFFGPGKAIIWMDNLYCKGNEHELHHCPFDGWKIHDCEANEVAGVVCKESIIQPSSAAADRVPAHPAPLPPTTTTSTAAVIPSLHRRHRLQLERGEDSDANQVINLQGNLLQPDLQLGQHHETTLPHAEPLLLPPDPSPSSPSPPSSRSAFHRLPLLSNPPPSTTISPSTTTTIASSSSASSSNQSQDVIRPTHNRSRQRQANHVPRLSQPLLQAASQYQSNHRANGHYAIRLNGGRNPYEGRIEVEKDGKWIPVCGDGFDQKAGAVVCRHLNYGYAYHAFATISPLDDVTSFDSSQDDPIIRLQCEGKEKLLSDCERSIITVKQCSPNQDNWASVICTQYLPDLIPDAAELESSVFLEDKQLILLQCASEENCLSSSYLQADRSTYDWFYESRRLLRFTAKIGNFGNADFRPLLHKASWNWHSCHKHYHSMETFAHFDILSYNEPGKRVAEGHKASFCLEDNDCDPGVTPKYKCADFGDQGISPGCKDIYLSKLDCQWIDITDLDPGLYVLKVTINPEMKVAESSFDNNSAVCTLVYDLSTARVHNCTLAPV